MTQAFYLPNRHRQNLEVLTGALVTRIITRKDGDLLIATGVEFEHSNARRVVNINEEVIVCAG